MHKLSVAGVGMCKAVQGFYDNFLAIKKGAKGTHIYWPKAITGNKNPSTSRFSGDFQVGEGGFDNSSSLRGFAILFDQRPGGVQQFFTVKAFFRHVFNPFDFYRT